MEKEIKAIIELMDQAEDFRPIVKKAIEILKSYSPELNELFDMAIDGIVKKKARMFHKLLNEGFDREDIETFLQMRVEFLIKKAIASHLKLSA